MTRDDINALYDDRAAPDSRAVLEDLMLGRGERVTRLGSALSYIDADAADDDDDDADADDDEKQTVRSKRFQNITNNLCGDLDMRNGLYLLRLPGRYYLVTRIGYVQRVGGDEYMLMPGARTVRKTSGERNLDDLAADGPKKDHKLSNPSRMGEPIHRLIVKRCFEANHEAWDEHIKAPSGEVLK